jgi:Trypsin-co-occurring domain 2
VSSGGSCSGSWTRARGSCCGSNWGPVELEATVAVEKGDGVGAKVRFWVIQLGGDAKATQASTQRLKLALQPRLATGGKALVAWDEAPGER